MKFAFATPLIASLLPSAVSATPLTIAQTAQPAIASIAPASGIAGPSYPIAATITGRGFVQNDNTVRFGPVSIGGLPSSDGQHIQFQVPKEMPARGEVPPIVIPPGEYQVTVTTPAGTSNAMPFSLKRDGS